MLHATDGYLRRLEDEPLAIPDRVSDHVENCRHCQERQARMRAEVQRCAAALGTLQPVPDLDAAWARFVERLDGERGPDTRRERAVSAYRARARLRRLPLRTVVVAGAIGVVIGGSAVAATLTTVFAPTHVAPVPLTQSDVGSLASFMGLGQSLGGAQGTGAGLLGGFPASSGSLSTSFGSITWSSPGNGAHVIGTLEGAEAAAGFSVRLPSRLPAGVNGPPRFVVQPRVDVTVKLAAGLPDVGGSSIALHTGPAVLAVYGSSSALAVPTLGVLTTPRPTAVASGASVSEIEAFILDRPGIPPDLAQEIRLLGDVGTTLPIPVPSGAVERSVDVAGSPGVLVADPSNIASGVVWEDGAGVIRAVAGLVDQHDALDVADELG